MKYRKKPIIIEAIRITKDNIDEVKAFMGDTLYQFCPIDDFPIYIIHTLEGVMHASPNDYIIRGIKGEVYPCKADIFEETYEEVE